jgi:hypothetical protein
MVTIQLDEHTASALETQAEAKGLSLAEYLRTFVTIPTNEGRPDWDTLQGDIDALSFDGPPLPADFSRADIYIDHD